MWSVENECSRRRVAENDFNVCGSVTGWMMPLSIKMGRQSNWENEGKYWVLDWFWQDISINQKVVSSRQSKNIDLTLKRKIRVEAWCGYVNREYFNWDYIIAKKTSIIVFSNMISCLKANIYKFLTDNLKMFHKIYICWPE